MSKVEAILARCKQLGITLTPTDRGTLRTSSRLPDDLRNTLREHKQEVLAWLKEQRTQRMPPDLMAVVETEEALFRLYWRTLPDKEFARATWPSELIHFTIERGVDPRVFTELRNRCADLLCVDQKA